MPRPEHPGCILPPGCIWRLLERQAEYDKDPEKWERREKRRKEEREEEERQEYDRMQDYSQEQEREEEDGE